MKVLCIALMYLEYLFFVERKRMQNFFIKCCWNWPQAVEQGNLVAVKRLVQTGAALDTLDKNDRYVFWFIISLITKETLILTL